MDMDFVAQSAREGLARFRLMHTKQYENEELWRKALTAGRRSLCAGDKLANILYIIRDQLGDLASQNIVEFGSYHGGSALFMATLLRELHGDARMYALDTFTGMPATSPIHDRPRVGQFSDADLDGFKASRDGLGLTNLHIVQGLLQDTFPTVDEAHFGLVHIDVDIYPSVKWAQAEPWKRLVPGGYLIYDDAEYPSCLGATHAAQEFSWEHRLLAEQVWPHWVYRKPP